MVKRALRLYGCSMGRKGWRVGIEGLGRSERSSLQHTYVNTYLGSVCRKRSLSVIRDVYDFHVTPGNKRNAYHGRCMKADVAERVCF